MDSIRRTGRIGSAAFTLLLSLLFSGCELESTTAPVSGGDSSGFDFGRVSWYGPNLSAASRDERAVLHSARIDPSQNVVQLSYDPLPGDWPRQVNAPGMLCLFEQLDDGTWRGGKVEWIDPGQKTKLLSNIDNGYNGWRRPAQGARVAVMIFSTDGRRHSNPAYSTYR